MVSDVNLHPYTKVGVNRSQVYSFIRDFTPHPVGTVEAVVSSAAKCAVDIPNLGCVVVFSETGIAANLASKYRPVCPIVVVTSSEVVVKRTNTVYAQYPFKVGRCKFIHQLHPVLKALGFNCLKVNTFQVVGFKYQLAPLRQGGRTRECRRGGAGGAS